VKELTPTYNVSTKKVNFDLTNNWSFNPLYLAGRSVNRASPSSSKIIVMRTKAALSSSGTSALIEMPYYEQPGNTCWATAGKMMTHGLPIASKAHTEEVSIRALMGVLQIGIDDGFNSFYKGASLAKVLGLNYGNYFRWSSISNKLIEELDSGHPVIYSGTFASVDNPTKKITHAVLIVGYENNSNGELVFIMHDPRNQGTVSMYRKVSWKDMQLDSFTQAITLFWSTTKASSSNSKFTLGLPTNGQFGRFYFEGKKTDKFKPVRYFLQFTPSVSKGYLWSDSETLPYPETVFRENVSELIMKFPIINSSSSSGSAFVSIEVYEKSNSSNKVRASQTLSVASHGQEDVDITVNLESLVKNLGAEVSECAVSIKLSENGTVSTWDILDGFELTRVTSDETTAYGCPWTYIPALDIENDGNVNMVNIKDADNYIQCIYNVFEGPKWLTAEWPHVDGSLEGMGKHYNEDKKLIKLVPFVDDEVHGVEIWYYESGVIRSEFPYINNEMDGLVKSYFQSGVLGKITPYSNGEMHGDQQSFTEDGVMWKCSTFNNGSFVGSCMP
ncbi:MAG: C39 family peptidase, partial [Campylobacterota bacterium]|nr:C39 family peptidase [Campylobacterota bacterium]